MTEKRKLIDRVELLYKSSIIISFDKVSLGLRDSSERQQAEYVHKDRLACRMFATGDVYVKDGVEPIYASINIEAAEKLIKDCGGKDENKDFWIDLEDYGWSKEPETYWGDGAFSANSDWVQLYLYCTDKEFPILQSIISESLRRDGSCNISVDIGHPDHMTRPDFGGHIESTEEYVDGLIDSGVPFYVRGWDISVDLKAEEDD